MPTIIAFHPNGYEIRFDVTLDELNAMVRKLEQRRYRPSRELTYTAEGLPICPRHGVPMAKREKQGDVWYSHKVTDPQSGEVLYCRGYGGPSSPGYAVPPAAQDPQDPETALPPGMPRKPDNAAENGHPPSRVNGRLPGEPPAAPPSTVAPRSRIQRRPARAAAELSPDSTSETPPPSGRRTLTEEEFARLNQALFG